jgi:hypothetical protein
MRNVSNDDLLTKRNDDAPRHRVSQVESLNRRDD